MNEHNVIGEVYSSRNFTFLRDTGTFVAEISEVRGVLRQLWNDSMDIGFGIRSERTGDIVYFTLKDSHVVEDGLLFWDFEVYNPSNRFNLHGLRVRIFND